MAKKRGGCTHDEVALKCDMNRCISSQPCELDGAWLTACNRTIKKEAIRMKNLKIDDDAHRILVGAREALENRGIENPNLSDAIRELDRRYRGLS